MGRAIIVLEQKGVGYMIPVRTKAEAEEVKRTELRKPGVGKVIVRKIGKKIYRKYGVTLDKKWAVWVYASKDWELRGR